VKNGELYCRRSEGSSSGRNGVRKGNVEWNKE